MVIQHNEIIHLYLFYHYMEFQWRFIFSLSLSLYNVACNEQSCVRFFVLVVLQYFHKM